MKKAMFALLTLAMAAVLVGMSDYVGDAEANAEVDEQSAYSFFDDTSGNFFGTVVMNGHDSTSPPDGLNGRSGLLRVTNSRFRYFETNIDVTIDFTNPQGDCPDGEIQLFPAGEIILSTRRGNGALFLKIDEDQSLCSGDSPEVLTATIGVFDAITQQVLSGKGLYSDVSGTATFLLPSDAQLRSGPVAGEPVVVYVHDGSFQIDFD